MIGRLLALPFKAAAWACIFIAFVLSAESGSDTLKKWIPREFWK